MDESHVEDDKVEREEDDNGAGEELFKDSLNLLEEGTDDKEGGTADSADGDSSFSKTDRLRTCRSLQEARALEDRLRFDIKLKNKTRLKNESLTQNNNKIITFHDKTPKRNSRDK